MNEAICTAPPGLLCDWWEHGKAMHRSRPVLAISVFAGEGTSFLTMKTDGTPRWVESDDPKFTLHFGG